MGDARIERVMLNATGETAARLEDLQEVLGEGPGYSAAASAQVEVCSLAEGPASRWPQFASAGFAMVGDVRVHAVPMQSSESVFGVMTLCQAEQPNRPLALDEPTLMKLAKGTGAALMRDPDATSSDLGRGWWNSRVPIHQATGMVVAQLGIAPNDALAVLRARAYAGGTTLADVASRVIGGGIKFRSPQ